MIKILRYVVRVLVANLTQSSQRRHRAHKDFIIIENIMFCVVHSYRATSLKNTFS
jgi:hypothetical protein